MASAVDICNLALAHLGDEANVNSIDPEDGSVQASLCKRFYPIARDALLEMHPWRFAVKRATLAAVTNNLDEIWLSASALPSDCLKPLNVYDDGYTSDTDLNNYVIESGVLYSNAETVDLRYTAYITDTTKFTPLFVNALSWFLAFYLVGPLTREPSRKDAIYKAFQVEFMQASASDSNAGRPLTNHEPAWIANR